MSGLLSPEVSSRLRFLLYRYRFLTLYVIFGGAALLSEVIVFRGMQRLGVPLAAAFVFGIAAGMGIAYWLNVRFNFKVPAAKRNRALVYFCLIASGSGVLNFCLNSHLQRIGWSYERARFLVAGSLFLVAYFFHRKFTFADYKKVGVAIYANGIEDIKGIFEKIGAFPDFVHVDVIDNTFGESQNDPKAYRLEVVQAYWPSKPVHIHIMSKRPSRWIREAAPFVDTVFVHMEIKEDVKQVIALIRDLGLKAGICITMATPVQRLREYVSQLDAIMLLAISTPGKSGQAFDMNALEMIGEINRWDERRGLELCVDGGVNERNVSLLNVESVVSGSSVLNSADPIRQIMRLQTSSNYEKV